MLGRKSGDNLLLPDMSSPSHFSQQLYLLLISYRDKSKEGKSREKVQEIKKRAQHHMKLVDEEC